MISYDYKSKIALLGDCNVGKTSLLQKCNHNNIIQNITPTVGVDIDIIEKPTPCGNKIKLQFWDFSGDEKYDFITQPYFSERMKYDCVIIMFSLSDKKTQENIQKWIDISKKCLIKNHTKVIIVGNKLDEVDVIDDLHQNFIYDSQYCYFDISVKLFENIDNLIQHIITTTINQYIESQKPVEVYVKPRASKLPCCTLL